MEQGARWCTNGVPRSGYGARFVTLQQALEQVEAKAHEQERRRKPMDVLDPSWGLDDCVKEKIW